VELDLINLVGLLTLPDGWIDSRKAHYSSRESLTHPVYGGTRSMRIMDNPSYERFQDPAPSIILYQHAARPISLYLPLHRFSSCHPRPPHSRELLLLRVSVASATHIAATKQSSFSRQPFLSFNIPSEPHQRFYSTILPSYKPIILFCSPLKYR
jgi:hypothetical protein